MGINNFIQNPPPVTPNTNNNKDTSLGIDLSAFIQAGGNDQSVVNELLINYNEKFALSAPTLFRDEIIDQTISILITKNKSNVLLVGQAGVGKTKIVEDIARRIATKDPSVPSLIQDYTIYELPISNIMSNTGVRGQLEEKMQSIIAFFKQNKAILFIDEIHMLNADKASYDTVAQLLKPVMARGEIKLIGATTLQESQKLLGDPAFSRRFSRILVDELTPEQTLEILKIIRPLFISHYDQALQIDDIALKEVIVYADQYNLAGNHRPDNAITLLDKAVAEMIVAREQKKSDPTLWNQIQKTKPTLSKMQIEKTAIKMISGNAKKSFIEQKQLEDNFSRIKGQDDIVNEIIKLIMKKQKGIFYQNEPLVLLFCGKSGVGKTQVAHIIAKSLTGLKPIVLNMGEFHTGASIARIIGAPPGYIGYETSGELPFDVLETNPYQVILLDEFEKCATDVQRLFMSAFDQGYITSSKGKTIDFSKSVIIATTNAGSTNDAKATMGFTTQETSNNPLKADIKMLSQYFDIELLNRFKRILTFNELTKEDYKQIIKDYYENEIERIRTKHGIFTLPQNLSDDILTDLVEASYNKDLGARPAKRVVEDYIEDNL